MNKLAIGLASLLIVGSVQAQEVSALVFGKSYHPDNRTLNETNPGLGLELATDPRMHGEGLGFQLLAGAYAVKDSCRKTGYAGYAGGRVFYQFAGDWRVESTLRAGYIQDCEYGGPAALPSIGIGYGRVTLEYAYIPKIRPEVDPTHVIWLRIRF